MSSLLQVSSGSLNSVTVSYSSLCPRSSTMPATWWVLNKCLVPLRTRLVGSDSRPLASQVHRDLVPCFLGSCLPFPHPIPCSLLYLRPCLYQECPSFSHCILSSIKVRFKPYLLQATFLKYVFSLKHFSRGQRSHGNRMWKVPNNHIKSFMSNNHRKELTTLAF